jgi:hypothetical protein
LCVDVAHKGDLSCFFESAGLVDADGVDPVPFSVCAEVHEHLVAAVGEKDEAGVAADKDGGGSGAPDIGYGIELGTV